MTVHMQFHSGEINVRLYSFSQSPQKKNFLLYTQVNIFHVIGDSRYKPDQTTQHFITVH